MKPIYIFRHITCEGPGYLSDFLERHRVPYRLIAIDQGKCVPPDLSDTSALVFMGGPMSVNDPLPWINDELRLIQQAREQNMPVLGHCLGGQLIAKAMGARVYANGAQEIGWHPVEKTDAASPWLADLPARFEVFHWHGETFDLPAGATPLLRSAYCENQAFALGSMLALQCHVEMTAPMIVEWAEMNREALAVPSASVQSRHAITCDADARVKNLHAIADVLYERWLASVLEHAAARA